MGAKPRTVTAPAATPPLSSIYARAAARKGEDELEELLTEPATAAVLAKVRDDRALSMMTQAVKGRPLAEVEKLFGDFHDLVAGEPGEEPETARVGKLAVFSGVREFPMRVKCATLPWHTMKAALEGDGRASTE